MPAYPPEPVIMAEAQRLAAENLDRDLDRVAELLAEQGHCGPDGKPYPARTVANLLDKELRRRRDERWRERNREAAESFNQWFADHGHEFIISGAATPQGAAEASGHPVNGPAEVDAVPTSYCVPADEYPLTPEECWFLMRGYMVRPARQPTDEEFHRMPGHIELLVDYLRLTH
ncbi:type II toxin-antitoxin system CcdA family antitoxin [Siccirubricoccus phaeus]|uniref:type II toxin-antitoxin system CcdA family antitoxin n=1 Tax=Siccirubricoccus phaeus TaxID=2595053 RepID=UPI0011F34A94|nr:type II toxin-antitoxin system CcdA family antitoxin [Siccirubricoccus phaeus]